MFYMTMNDDQDTKAKLHVFDDFFENSILQEKHYYEPGPVEFHQLDPGLVKT